MSGQKCYITPAFSGGPQTKRDKIRIGYATPAFLGVHEWAEVLHNPCIPRGPQTKGDKIRIGCLTLAFSGAHKWAEVLHNPYILRGPQTKRDKIRIGYLTPAFSGAHKWSEMLHSGSVRWTKQTLPPKRGGGVRLCENPTFAQKFGQRKKRGGGYVKPPMLSFSADAHPPLILTFGDPG